MGWLGEELSTDVNGAPETSALLAARRATILVFAGVGAAAQLLTSVGAREMLTPLEAVGTAFALVLVLVGALVRKRDVGLWILAAGAWLLVALNFLPGAGGPWLLINSAAIFGALALALAAPAPVVVTGLVVLPVLLHLAWSAHPDAVVATGYEVMGGWVPPLQVFAVLLITSLAWRRSRREAAIADLEFERKAAKRNQLLAEQARQHARRRVIVRVHETLLNTIKMARDPDVSPAGLASYIPEGGGPSSASQEVPLTLGDAVTLAVQPWSAQVTLSMRKGFGASVPRAVSEVLVSAVVELLRNAFRHEHEPKVRIVVGGSSEDLEVRILGIHSPSAPQLEGIGLREAVRESIHDLHGDVVVVEDAVLITIPHARADSDTGRQGHGVFIRSRALMAAVLTGIAVGGSPYLLSLGVTGAPWLPVVAILVVTVILVGTLGLLEYRQRRIPVSAGALLVGLAALVPWLAVAAFHETCGGMGLTLASAMNLSGIILVALSMWTNPWILVPGLTVWATGIGVLLASSPAQCTSSIPVAVVNALLVIPIVFVGVSLAARGFSRSKRMADEAHDLEIQTRAAMQVDAEVMSQLADLELEAMRTMRRILEEGGSVDDDRRHLASIDAQIRAVLQVDLGTDGALPTLAADLIATVSGQGHPINVRGIDHSPDRRPLDDRIHAALEQVVWGEDPVIGVFFDGVGEHLFLTATVPAGDVPEPGLDSLTTYGDATLAIERADGGTATHPRLAVMLTRTRIAADSPSLVVV